MSSLLALARSHAFSLDSADSFLTSNLGIPFSLCSSNIRSRHPSFPVESLDDSWSLSMPCLAVGEERLPEPAHILMGHDRLCSGYQTITQMPYCASRTSAHPQLFPVGMQCPLFLIADPHKQFLDPSCSCLVKKLSLHSGLLPTVLINIQSPPSAIPKRSADPL